MYRGSCPHDGICDDTTIVGDAQDPSWLQRVSDCYMALHSAGFVIDSHRCFRGMVTTYNKYSPQQCLNVVVDSTQFTLASSNHLPVFFAPIPPPSSRSWQSRVYYTLGTTCCTTQCTEEDWKLMKQTANQNKANKNTTQKHNPKPNKNPPVSNHTR